MSANEWSATAAIVADDCLGIRKGEKVLLLAGEGIEKEEGMCDLFSAVKEELFMRDLNPTIISYRAGRGAEPSVLVEKACCSADVIITIFVRGLLHSGVFPRVQKYKKPNARILMLPDSNNFNFLNRMMPKTKEEFYDVSECTERIGSKFLGGPHKVHLTSGNGTDLAFTLGSLSGWNHTGIGKDPGSFAMLPAGTLNVGVDEGSAEGILVIDTYTALAPDLLKDRIVFEVHKGYATSVTGGKEADDFLAAAEKHDGSLEEKFCIAEFGLGFSKTADYHVNLEEGEHVYAAAHIGIGSNATFGGNVMIPAWHTDSLLPDATVELDGTVIAKDGEYKFSL